MYIISNDRLIHRNNRLGLIATIAGLVVLGIGMYISFTKPKLISFSMLALLFGFILSQVGIYYSNRWGRSPRPDEVLSGSLKSLDNKYSLYHYCTPVSHLLVGPAGIWILQPHIQKGTITYEKGRWKQRGGNWYLKIFAQEGLGRPDLEVSGERNALEKFLKENFPDDELEVNTALVFMHPKVEIAIPEDETPPAETIHVTKLKDYLRKSVKTKPLEPEKISQITSLLNPS
jgi:hypothetical protein